MFDGLELAKDYSPLPQLLAFKDVIGGQGASWASLTARWDRANGAASKKRVNMLQRFAECESITMIM